MTTLSTGPKMPTVWGLTRRSCTGGIGPRTGCRWFRSVLA